MYVLQLNEHLHATIDLLHHYYTSRNDLYDIVCIKPHLGPQNSTNPMLLFHASMHLQVVDWSEGGRTEVGHVHRIFSKEQPTGPHQVLCLVRRSAKLLQV